jgi:hypothetical protein
MTATLIAEYDHTPALKAAVEGGLQALPDGDVFMGWGSEPAFSEDNASGQQIFDAHFNKPIASYRAYRFTWDAQPPTSPALTASANARGSRLYVSWNGATDVSSWRVLAGASPRRLGPVATSAKTGFETAISVHSNAHYFAVQALDVHGRVLARSRALAIHTRPHSKAGHR